MIASSVTPKVEKGAKLARYCEVSLEKISKRKLTSQYLADFACF
jgi:hypothetical protein